jgi:pseudouridine-5'-monophosphatase
MIYFQSSRGKITDYRSQTNSNTVQIALATSSTRANFENKTAHLQPLLNVFKSSLCILGDDVRLPPNSSKPHPNIYLLALRSINESLIGTGQGRILPEECLVFEDAVSGVLAGRRAGMQVAWVPHSSLSRYYEGREAEVSLILSLDIVS